MSALVARSLVRTITIRGCVRVTHYNALQIHHGAIHSINVRLFSTPSLHREPKLLTTELTFRQSRWYAKRSKRDKGKKDGKSSVEMSEEELNAVIDFNKMSQQMALAVEHLKQEYIEQVTLRTSVGAFDNLIVDTEDGKFPLIQLGQLAQKSPQLIVINLTTSPQYIPSVKTAIMNSGMNLSPQQDGTTLFVPIPKVTREHRENLAKNTKTLCDKTKDKLKDIQNRYVRDLKKAKSEHSEDLVRNVQDTILARMHHYAEEASNIMTMKQHELLGTKHRRLK